MRLIVEDDEGRRTVVPLYRDELGIGRAEGNSVRLTEKDVSRRHAKLVRRSGLFYVEDLDSFTGVRVNGDRIRGAQQIREGDLIEISRYDLGLEAGPDEKAAPDPRAAGETTAPVPRPPQSGRKRRIATLVLILLVAAAVAAALWLREVRGAHGRPRGEGDRRGDPRLRHFTPTTDPEQCTKTSQGSVPPEPCGDLQETVTSVSVDPINAAG
jgi:pSer/pThr/pTyr-binding forkhead associated (FHA) protein